MDLLIDVNIVLDVCAIFTNDDELAKVIRQIARHGQDRRYHHIRVGVNSRLDTLQAAIQ